MFSSKAVPIFDLYGSNFGIAFTFSNSGSKERISYDTCEGNQNRMRFL